MKVFTTAIILAIITLADAVKRKEMKMTIGAINDALAKAATDSNADASVGAVPSGPLVHGLSAVGGVRGDPPTGWRPGSRSAVNPEQVGQKAWLNAQLQPLFAGLGEQGRGTEYDLGTVDEKKQQIKAPEGVVKQQGRLLEKGRHPRRSWPVGQGGPVVAGPSEAGRRRAR